MKTIAVSVDDETYRRAEAKAAARRTSVSALLDDFLHRLAGTAERDWSKPAEPEEFERLKREETELRKTIGGLDTSNLLTRDQLHDRRL